MILKKWSIIFCFILIFGGMFQIFAQDTQDAQSLLNMSLDDLLNVQVITASKTTEKLSDAPGVITVVTKDELQRFGGNTLKDVLARVPSLSGTSTYFSDRSMITARGAQVKFNSGHILILINGRPVREITEGGVGTDIYESFPVNIIEKIEVIKGPGSVLYGSNAFSAVINIITETVVENTVVVNSIAGLNEAFGTNGKTTLQKGAFNLVAAARHLKKANWETTYKAGSPLFINDIEILNTGQGGYVGMNYKNLNFMSSFTQFKTSFYNLGYCGENRWKKGFTDLGYKLSASKIWNMDFNITYTWSSLHATEFPQIHRTSNDVVAEWTNYISPFKKFHIIVGGLVNYIRGKELNYSSNPHLWVSDEYRTSYGLYSQMDYQILATVKVIGGFQANKFKNLDLNLVPRTGIIWYPFTRINVKALYSEAFRAPSINEIGMNFPTFKGNPNLLPEKVKTMDLGLNYLGDRMQLGMNYFISKQTNIIIIDFVPSPITFSNLGEMEFNGVEFEGKYYVNRALFLTGSFLYQTNKNKSGMEDNTPLPKFSGKAGVSYMSDNGVTVGLFNIYQGPLAKQYKGRLNPVAGEYNLVSLYSQVNINKFFHLNSGIEYSLYLQGDNLLNIELWLPDWGGAKGETIPMDQGRAVYMGLNLTL